MGRFILKYCAFILVLSFSFFGIDCTTTHFSSIKPRGIPIIAISSSVFPFRSGQVAYYRELTVPPDSVSEIKIDFNIAYNNTSSDQQIAFGIVQVHSCYYNIGLAYNSTLVSRFHEIGTNLGLIVRNGSGPSSVFIHNSIYRGMETQISIAFLAYNRSDPIPGGCSMERSMAEVPSLVLNVNTDMTTVDTPLAAMANGSCNVAAKLGYTGYHRFLKKFDFSCGSYFTFLRSMMTADQINQNGQLGFAHPTTANRRTYVTVPGTGVVFATLVTDLHDGSLATYVPVYSVACSPIFWESKCDVFSSPMFHVLNLMLICVGIIRAYLGSFLFCIGAVIDGFVLGAFLAFYAQSNWFADYQLSVEQEITVLSVAGGLLALVMFAIWFLCPFAEMITQIPTNFIVGYLLAAFTTTVFRTADWRVSGFWYESVFLLIILILVLILPPFWNPSGILVSVAWGTFAIMQAVFFIRNSHSSYWVLNSFNTFRNKEFR